MLHAFSGCGAVVDSRMCGDPNSALRFAFIEFDGEDAVTKARAAHDPPAGSGALTSPGLGRRRCRFLAQ
jgi:hypothetical protein